jgi:hypothetical protein
MLSLLVLSSFFGFFFISGGISFNVLLGFGSLGLHLGSELPLFGEISLELSLFLLFLCSSFFLISLCLEFLSQQLSL